MFVFFVFVGADQICNFFTQQGTGSATKSSGSLQHKTRPTRFFFCQIAAEDLAGVDDKP